MIHIDEIGIILLSILGGLTAIVWVRWPELIHQQNTDSYKRIPALAKINKNKLKYFVIYFVTLGYFIGISLLILTLLKGCDDDVRDSIGLTALGFEIVIFSSLSIYAYKK